ncbi:hypothetical protein Hanom_Chr00s103575g01804871 [Helianthus anomalus]
MARRDSDYSYACRIADRGNGIDGPESRARGEDKYPSRRIADRGSGRVGAEPRDFKIRRLQQRVRDLELQNEIHRLKQRIHDLEAPSTWEETEPEGFVGDELSGDEEHPTNGDTIYDSPPVYDEYRDEEWYSLFSGGDRNSPGDESGSKGDNLEGVTEEKEEESNDHEYVQVSSGICDFFHKIEGVNLSATGSDGVVKSGDLLAMEIPTIEPKIMVKLKDYSLNNERDNHSNIQIEVISKVSKLVDMSASDSRKNSLFFPNMWAIQEDNNSMAGPNVKKDRADLNYAYIASVKKKCVVDFVRSGEALDYWVSNNKLMDSEFFVQEKRRLFVGPPPASKTSKGGEAPDMQIKMAQKYVELKHTIGPTTTNSGSSGPTKAQLQKSREKNSVDLGMLCYQFCNTFIAYTQLWNKRWSNAPFDPGGTSLESGKIIYEVESFRWVVIIRNRVDVSFDSGGFGSKTKLEDEFFSKRGSMMQEHIRISYIFI